MSDTCAGCGKEFEALGQHLHQVDCPYPEISEHKIEVLTGLLMGDASLYRQANLPFFQVRMINQDFLEYLDGKFGTLGRGVSFDRSAEETEKQLSELSPNTDSSNCSDIHLWRTMAHPTFNQFRSWYDSGEKVFPDVQLTPTTLKYWYVSDGSLDTKHSTYISISAYNERQRKQSLMSLFEETPVQPSRIDSRGKINFDKQNSIDMLDWMGKPLPGFEYKWGL